MPNLGASAVGLGLASRLPGVVSVAQDTTPGLQPTLPAGAAPWTFINGQVGGAGTSRVFTVPANQPATQQGDTLIITLNIASSTMTISAVVDSAGNTYTLDSASITTAPQQRNYRCANANPVAPGQTVTVTTSATNANCCLGGLCIPGAYWQGVPDVIGSVVHVTSAVSQTQSITPTADYDLILFINVNQSIGGPNYTQPPFFGWWINTGVPGTNEITWSYLPCGAGTAGVAQTCTVNFGQSNNGYMAGFAFKSVRPKMATLTDDFNAVTLDTTKWNAYPEAGGGTVTVAGGVLQLGIIATTSGFSVLQSVYYYDLTSSTFSARLTSAGNQAVNTLALIKVQVDANNGAQLLVQNGTISAQHQVAATWGGLMGSVTYDPTVHKWLRLREAGGTLYYEYSADGINWTALYSEANPFALTSVQASIQQGQNGTTDPASTSQWSDVNTPATPYQAGSGLTTGSVTSRTAAVTTPTAAGDTLLVQVTTNATACSISNLVDSQGNVYILDASYQVAVPMTYWYRCPGATGGPGGGPTVALGLSDTLTATSSGTGNVQIMLVCAPGVGSVDLAQTGNGSNPNPARSFTPRNDNEMCIALLANGNSPGAPNINPPYSLLNTYHTGVNPYNTVAYVQLGAGTNGVGQNFTGTLAGSGQWYVMNYVFYPFVVWPAAGTADNTSMNVASGNIGTLMAMAGTASGASSANGTLITPGASNPYLAGSVTVNSSTTVTVPITTATTAGDTLYAVMCCYASAQTTTGFTDTKGNVYTLDKSYTTGTNPPYKGWAYISPGATGGPGGGPTVALTTSDTASPQGLTSSSDRYEVMLVGIPSASWDGIDVSAALSAGTSSTTEGDSATPTADSELSIGWAATGINSGAPQWHNSYVSLGYVTGAGLPNGPFLSVAYLKLGTGTSGVVNSTNSTTTNAANYIAGQVIFKVAVTAVQWALAGTASNTSQASGTVALIMAAAGTAVNASQTTGAITETMAAAGTASNVSAGTGTITETLAAAGTASNVSSATGTLDYKNIAGTASNTSSASGAVTLTEAVAGTASNASAASGAVTLAEAIAGTASSASTGTSAITMTLVATGTASNASTAAGTLDYKNIAGTSSNVSTGAGAITETLAASGTASNASSTTGAITMTLAASGTASNASAATGTITETLAAAGTSASASTASGVFGAQAANGTATNTSTGTGAITAKLAASGSAANVPVESGSLGGLLAAAGTASNATTGTGAVTATLAASGTSSAVSSAIGNIVKLISIAATTVVLSLASGILTYPSTTGTSVTVSSATGTLGLFTPTRYPQHYGGIALEQNFLGGHAVNLNDVGTGLGGKIVSANTLGGLPAASQNLLGGTVTGNQLGGTVTGNVFSATLEGWTMIQQDITVGQYNDETFALTLTNGTGASPPPLNLTGLTLEAYLKPSAASVDTDAGVIKLSTATGEITITNAAGGLANMAVPSADLQQTGVITFWRLDVVNAGKRNTIMYGAIHMTDL